MTTVNISVTYPDAKQAALLDALRWHYGPKDPDADPVVEYTNAELIAVLGDSVRKSVRDIYERHQKYLRKQGALDTIDITEA